MKWQRKYLKKSKTLLLKGSCSLTSALFPLHVETKECFTRYFTIFCPMPLSIQDSERLQLLKLADTLRIQKMFTMSKIMEWGLICNMQTNCLVFSIENQFDTCCITNL